MALVSNHPTRCYYNGLTYDNTKDSSSKNLHNNANNTNFNGNDSYSSNTAAKSQDPPLCAAPSVQTTFDHRSTKSTNGNATSNGLTNGGGNSLTTGEDSAGPSSTSSSSSVTTASYGSSSLLAAPPTAPHREQPQQRRAPAGHPHAGHGHAGHAQQRCDVPGVVVNGGNQSSSGCSSFSPVAGANRDPDSEVNAHPDKPIGYGAFGVVWSVTDPRSGKRVALKKMPNVFQNLASCKRVFREIRMLSSFKHDNILSCLDILQPTNPHLFQEIYVITELMQSDLHKIIVSPQALSTDHIKVFLYQILRGVKYLQSANIIHRDIKPGNLLVNSNCVLKICDFGLARTWDPADQGHMTHEVVTQYYRAPELLMGARRYTTSVDVWSIGCIFAEMLGRRILFQAQGPIDQLNLIIDLLGTPTISQMKYACDGARCHVLKSAYRPPNAAKLYTLSPQATHDAVHLLTQMLDFDPDQRITVEQALAYQFVEEGRLRFHSCMCTCCYTSRDGTRVFGSQPEPSHADPFDPRWEKDLCRFSMYDLRDRIYKFVADRPSLYNVPLCINPHSAAYKNFTSSNCAQFNEMPPSPQVWE